MMQSQINKSDKGKGKFQSLNINHVYKGKAVEQQHKPAYRQYGMQVLGKVQGVRRMPPPAFCPSLKSESGGNSSGTGPSGSGWAASSFQGGEMQRQEQGQPQLHINSRAGGEMPRQEQGQPQLHINSRAAALASAGPPRGWSGDKPAWGATAGTKPFNARDFPRLREDSPASGGSAAQANNGATGGPMATSRPQNPSGATWRLGRQHEEGAGGAGASSLGEHGGSDPVRSQRPGAVPLFNSPPSRPFYNEPPSGKDHPQRPRGASPVSSSDSSSKVVKGDIAATGWAAIEDEPNFDEKIVFSDEEEEGATNNGRQLERPGSSEQLEGKWQSEQPVSRSANEGPAMDQGSFSSAGMGRPHPLREAWGGPTGPGPYMNFGPGYPPYHGPHGPPPHMPPFYHGVPRMPMGPVPGGMPSGLERSDSDPNQQQQRWMGEQRNARSQEYQAAIERARKKKQEDERNLKGGDMKSLQERDQPNTEEGAPGGPPSLPPTTSSVSHPPHMPGMPPYGMPPPPHARFAPPWPAGFPPMRHPMGPPHPHAGMFPPHPAFADAKLMEKWMEFLQQQQQHKLALEKKEKAEKVPVEQKDPFEEEESGGIGVLQRLRSTGSDSKCSDTTDAYARPPSTASSGEVHGQPRILRREPNATAAAAAATSGRGPVQTDTRTGNSRQNAQPVGAEDDRSSESSGRMDRQQRQAASGPVPASTDHPTSQSHGDQGQTSSGVRSQQPPRDKRRDDRNKGQRKAQQQGTQQQPKAKPLMEKDVPPPRGYSHSGGRKGDRERTRDDHDATRDYQRFQQQYHQKRSDNQYYGEDYTDYNYRYQSSGGDSKSSRGASSSARRGQNTGSSSHDPYYGQDAAYYGRKQPRGQQNVSEPWYDEEEAYEDEEAGGASGYPRKRYYGRGRGTRGMPYSAGRGSRGGRSFVRGGGSNSYYSRGGSDRHHSGQEGSTSRNRGGSESGRRRGAESKSRRDGDSGKQSKEKTPAESSEAGAGESSAHPTHSKSGSPAKETNSTSDSAGAAREEKASGHSSQHQQSGGGKSRYGKGRRERSGGRGKKDGGQGAEKERTPVQGEDGSKSRSASKTGDKSEGKTGDDRKGKGATSQPNQPSSENTVDSTDAKPTPNTEASSTPSETTGTAATSEERHPPSSSRPDSSNRNADRNQRGAGGGRNGGRRGSSNAPRRVEETSRQVREYRPARGGSGPRGRAQGSYEGRGTNSSGGGGREMRQASVPKDVLSDGNEQEEWETASEGSEPANQQQHRSSQRGGGSNRDSCNRRGGNNGGGSGGGNAGGSGAGGGGGTAGGGGGSSNGGQKHGGGQNTGKSTPSQQEPPSGGTNNNCSDQRHSHQRDTVQLNRPVRPWRQARETTSKQSGRGLKGATLPPRFARQTCDLEEGGRRERVTRTDDAGLVIDSWDNRMAERLPDRLRSDHAQGNSSAHPGGVQSLRAPQMHTQTSLEEKDTSSRDSGVETAEGGSSNRSSPKHRVIAALRPPSLGKEVGTSGDYTSLTTSSSEVTPTGGPLGPFPERCDKEVEYPFISMTGHDLRQDVTQECLDTRINAIKTLWDMPPNICKVRPQPVMTSHFPTNAGTPPISMVTSLPGSYTSPPCKPPFEAPQWPGCTPQITKAYHPSQSCSQPYFIPGGATQPSDTQKQQMLALFQRQVSNGMQTRANFLPRAPQAMPQQPLAPSVGFPSTLSNVAPGYNIASYPAGRGSLQSLVMPGGAMKPQQPATNPQLMHLAAANQRPASQPIGYPAVMPTNQGYPTSAVSIQHHPQLGVPTQPQQIPNPYGHLQMTVSQAESIVSEALLSYLQHQPVDRSAATGCAHPPDLKNLSVYQRQSSSPFGDTSSPSNTCSTEVPTSSHIRHPQPRPSKEGCKQSGWRKNSAPANFGYETPQLSTHTAESLSGVGSEELHRMVMQMRNGPMTANVARSSSLDMDYKRSHRRPRPLKVKEGDSVSSAGATETSVIGVV